MPLHIAQMLQMAQQADRGTEGDCLGQGPITHEPTLVAALAIIGVVVAFVAVAGALMNRSRSTE
jgi:hypothetical protein